MGLYSDILEASLDGVAGTATWPLVRRARPEPPPRPMFPCTLCGAQFSEAAELHAHIFAEHRESGHYLRVNGQIAPELVQVEEPLRELVLFVAGIGRWVIEVHVPGLEVQQSSIHPNAECDLLRVFPTLHNARGPVSIGLPMANVAAGFTYTLYCQVPIPVDTDRADRAVLALQLELNRALENGSPEDAGQLLGEMPDHLSALRRDFPNPLEQRYLDGFFEYSLGSLLDCQGDPAAGSRLSTAHTRLKPFDSLLASTVRSIVSLRLNWFDGLMSMLPASRFWPASWFFNQFSARELRWPEGPASTVASFGYSGTGVWLDPLLLGVIDGCGYFALRSFDEAWAICDEMSKRADRRDLNDQVKLALLRARTAAALGMSKEVARTYRQLQYHPIFGKEAQWGIREAT